MYVCIVTDYMSLHACIHAHRHMSNIYIEEKHCRKFCNFVYIHTYICPIYVLSVCIHIVHLVQIYIGHTYLYMHICIYKIAELSAVFFFIFVCGYVTWCPWLLPYFVVVNLNKHSFLTELPRSQQPCSVIWDDEFC